jgi:hypothetical protein
MLKRMKEIILNFSGDIMENDQNIELLKGK